MLTRLENMDHNPLRLDNFIWKKNGGLVSPPISWQMGDIIFAISCALYSFLEVKENYFSFLGSLPPKVHSRWMYL